MSGRGKLYRDRWDKKIAGVCGGFAQWLRIDSSLIRLLSILLLFLSAGIFIIAYALMWYLIPMGPRAYIQPNYRRLYRSKRNRRLSGVLGGFGRYFRIDPNILRLIYMVLFFVTGLLPLIIIYIICVVVIPEEP